MSSHGTTKVELTSTYPLNIPNDEVWEWLRKHGRMLIPPVSDLLPDKPGMAYVRHSAPYDHQIALAAFVVLKPPILSEFTKGQSFSWMWFEVPKLLVLPFTDAPLF